MGRLSARSVSAAAPESRITQWRKPGPRHSNALNWRETLNGKQSWSCVRRTGKGRGTVDRFPQIVSGVAQMRTRRDPEVGEHQHLRERPAHGTRPDYGSRGYGLGP